MCIIIQGQRVQIITLARVPARVWAIPEPETGIKLTIFELSLLYLVEGPGTGTNYSKPLCTHLQKGDNHTEINTMLS